MDKPHPSEPNPKMAKLAIKTGRATSWSSSAPAVRISAANTRV